MPTLLRRNLGQVGRGALRATLIVELDADAVYAERPVQVTARLLEALQD